MIGRGRLFAVAGLGIGGGGAEGVDLLHADAGGGFGIAVEDAGQICEAFELDGGVAVEADLIEGVEEGGPVDAAFAEEGKMNSPGRWLMPTASLRWQWMMRSPHWRMFQATSKSPLRTPWEGS